MTLDLYSGPSACRVAGITYRQLDYWARTGLVTPTVAAGGSGTQRGYSFGQLVELRVIASLIAAVGESGLGLYRRLNGASSLTQGLGVQLTIDREAIADLVRLRITELRVVPRTFDGDPRVAAGRAALPPQFAAAR